MVETAEQARALVAATRYPPRGIRSLAGRFKTTSISDS
jgi:2-keto-3-deoxy-L-rhamnonate aldolase RhmA